MPPCRRGLAIHEFYFREHLACALKLVGGEDVFQMQEHGFETYRPALAVEQGQSAEQDHPRHDPAEDLFVDARCS